MLVLVIVRLRILVEDLHSCMNQIDHKHDPIRQRDQESGGVASRTPLRENGRETKGSHACYMLNFSA